MGAFPGKEKTGQTLGKLIFPRQKSRNRELPLGLHPQTPLVTLLA